MKTTSLPLSKRLQALGVKQDSAFYWKYSNGMMERISKIEGPTTEVIFGTQPTFETLGTWTTCSAYLAEELGELLPDDWFLSLSRTVNRGYAITLDPIEDTVIYADSLTEIMGECLAYLLEQGLTSNEK